MNPFLSARTTEQKEIPAENVLTDILRQEHQCLEQLSLLLNTESTAILEHEIKIINHLLDKKLMLISKLEQLNQQRQNFFEQQTGMSYTHSDFSQFIQQHPSNIIQDSWQAVKVKLPECKKQNEVNGRMIDIKKNNTDQILQLLLGRPGNSSPTYSHLGQPSLHNKSALYTEV